MLEKTNVSGTDPSLAVTRFERRVTAERRSVRAAPTPAGSPRPSPLIAVNAAVVGERPTGLGIYAVNAIEALAALGERLMVYTSRPEAITAAPSTQIRRITAAARPERGRRGHLARLLWVQLGLRRQLRRDRPEILLSLMPEGLFWPSIPQVVTVHDVLPLHYPREYPRQQYYFRHYVPAVLRRSRAVITISEASRQEIIRAYQVPAEKIHVALCGYDARRFTPYGPESDVTGSEPYALYVGNVMPHKNLGRLVDAFATVSGRMRGRLVIRGWGKRQPVETLRARIARHGLEDRVDWQPYASDGELPALYRGARMLVLPSLAEGFGLTALEAMACGTPVITSNTSSLPEVVADAGLLVDPHDTTTIAEAMARLFSDTRLAKELRERGIARASQFTWERAAGVVQRAIHASALEEG
jgi:glycosyltransferase involved in cell wall biosynthesis